MTDIEEFSVLIIPFDSDPYYSVFRLPKRQSLVFFSGLYLANEEVVGKPVEHVRVFADFHGGANFRYLDMFVNEDGHTMKPPLPLNVYATAIYQNNVLFHEPGVHRAEDLPTIVGNAVLYEEIVWR